MDLPERVTVVVVGAGVAGCATALHLARRGHDVAIVDRAAFPRDKVCGEGLLPHGVTELDRLGLLDAVRGTGARPFRGIAYHVGTERAFGRFPPREPHRDGLGLRRLRVDAALADAVAAEPGVTLHTGVRFRGVHVDDGHVTVRTDQGEVRARAMVGADGMRSEVRRALALDRPDPAPPRYGVRAHYRLRGAPPDEVRVHVEADVELYLTPTGPDELNVAILCGRDVTRALGGDLLEGFQRLVAACEPVAALLQGAEPIDAPMLVGPLRQRVRGVVSDRALLVGDAAGFVDAITGEGMSLALVGARLAADTLHEALGHDRLDRRALRPYAKAHARACREATFLAEIVLWGLRHRRLARRVVRNLGRHPDLFGQILSVGTGQSGLAAIGPLGIARLLVG